MSNVEKSNVLRSHGHLVYRSEISVPQLGNHKKRPQGQETFDSSTFDL